MGKNYHSQRDCFKQRTKITKLCASEKKLWIEPNIKSNENFIALNLQMRQYQQGLDIDDGPFTLDEFKKVKTSLKLGKSAGLDEIPPEVFKCCNFDDICLNFCDKVLMPCDKPPQWSFMNIISVPKSGDLSVTDNYRGISLTCIMAKIFNRLILKRY